jgi:hypothetical protein
MQSVKMQKKDGPKCKALKIPFLNSIAKVGTIDNGPLQQT